MVKRYFLPPQPINTQPVCLAFFQLTVNRHRMQILAIGCVLDIGHFCQYRSVLRLNLSVIGYLAAHFRIKRGFVKNQLRRAITDIILQLIINDNVLQGRMLMIQFGPAGKFTWGCNVH